MNGDSGSRGLLPIGLVAIAAVLYSLVPGGGAPVSTAPVALPQPAPKEPTAAVVAENEILRPLCEYLDMVGENPPVAPCPPPNSAEKPCLPDDLHPVRFLITTVPDPIDSHLAQSFDRAVDAIQKGMQDSGYILDRFYLPWRRDGEARWNISRLLPGAPDGFLSVNAKTIPPDLHRSMPGTLLFRATHRSGPGAGEELVVVFLIGETPTSGVQRVAMTRTLDAIESCPTKKLPCVSSCETSEIRIVGPYFSGSTDSLRHLLWAWNRTRKKKIAIVSGSATVDRNGKQLRSGRESKLVGDISFQATVVPDSALTGAFNEFLIEQLKVEPRDKVALFVEGGTSYGSGYKDISSGKVATSRSSGRNRKPADTRETETPAKTAASRPGSQEEAATRKGFRFVVSFPLHVSQLRGAYEKDGSLRTPAPARGAPRQSLELALDAPEGATRDIVPAQDPQMTANIADLVLSSSLETIRREEIRFVGIAASDPRDILFLARKIRENAANVTLFTFGADLLYTHPDYQRYLRGMLVITPYPLFPANQAWTGSDDVRLAFPGATEEGIYNAVAYQLRGPDPAKARALLEYRPPFAPEDSDPSDRPPIWITAVGRHGFWPVDIKARYDDTGEKKHAPGDESSSVHRGDGDEPGYVVRSLPPTLHPSEVKKYRPPGGLLTFILLEGLFIGVIALYVALRRKPVPVSRDNPSRRSTLVGGFFRRAETILSVWSEPEAREINRTYVLTLLLLFTLLQATVVVYVSRVFAYLPADVFFVVFSAVVLLCLLALVGSEIQLLVSAIRRLRVQNRSAWRHGVVPLIFLTAISVVLVLYWIDIVGMSPGLLLSFYVRAFDLSSSISPLLPILLTFAVLILWALSNIQRAFLLEIEGNGPPASQDPSPTLVGVSELECNIQRLLTDPTTRALALLAPALALIPFYGLVIHSFDAMDGWQLSLLVKFLLLSCYFVIVYSFTLFFALWLRVRRLLQRLSWHPVAEAFKRLPDSVAASPWRMWRAVPSLTGLEASVSLLQALVNLAEGSLEEGKWVTLKEKAGDAQSLLDEAVVETGRSFASSLPTQRALRLLLADVMRLLLEPLENAWREWPGRADAQRDVRKSGDKEQFFGVPDWLRRDIPGGKPLWIRAAEEFVALRLSSYAHYVFLHMRNLLTFVFLGFLLVIAAINSYPFQPKHPVMALIWVVGVACIALVAWSFLGMNRDRILSYIGKTAPGEVTMSFEFLSSMTIYVIVPLLTLLATQFPSIGDVVFSVFSPTVKSLR